ncbi:hypothetical protein J2W25_005681 [Variovorax boronicumulans]|uniref:Uncharacterized protein n=1 Tax=Variovorax boronicumulans TaxID=436515 RepID=A0AAW8E4A3_9BURK|nr:hypothetical protein [Variovorax boronicumulans]MDP9881345.1 hypothetical protein [Variovorax boronicumulans]MDP9926632.1 hypothetical protein [Variovorax boronicumulans]
MSMPSTSVEFVTELMEVSAHGALIQAFVMQALEQYARRVAETDPQALDTPMVCGRAWHGCALEVLQKLEQRFET